MNPKFEQIIKKLENWEHYSIVCFDEEQYIESARLITHQKVWNKKIAYIGYANQLHIEYPLQEGNFILIGSIEEIGVLKDKILHQKRGNWCLVPEEEAVNELMNKVQDILSDFQSFTKSSAALLNSMIQGRGLAYIMEIASELLGNPVMLGDSHHRLLAYSRCDDVKDNAWNEFRNTGYCTYEYTVKYDFKPLVEKSARLKGPIVGNLGEVSRINRIFATVQVEDIIVGHLAVLEHRRPFEEKDLDIVAFICELIATEMQKNAQYFDSRNVMLQNLLLDLLNENHIGEENIRDRIKYIKWRIPSKMYVLVIEYHSYEETYTLIPYIRDTLTQLFTEEETVIYENKLVIILGCEENAYINKSQLVELDLFLKKNGLKAGISQEFNDVIELKNRMTQAVNALAMGKKIGKDEVIYLYEDYGIYHMIQLASTHHDVEDFCHPSVLKLKKYDAEHHTEYLKTVYAYVSNMKNLVATANSLYIHRNTLSYRMPKIYELIGNCLDNDEIAMKFFISYKILEYTGKL